MRLIGYVRVSRVACREGESFLSPVVQCEKIEAQAKAGGHTLVDVIEDLDQPGSRYEREGFQQALARVEAGEADGIIVYALDRFARSVPDAAVALRRLEEADATLVSVRDALDTSTPVGRFARTMMLALAELELDRIRENWATARDRAIGRGVHISRVPPLGYRKRDDGRLEPDPATAHVVIELFQRRGEGVPWRDLCAYLDDVLPREQGAWPLSSVQSLIHSRTYLGLAHAGEVSNPDAHLPLVTRAQWEAANRRQPYAGRSLEGGALLRGLIRCASCGGVMSRVSDGARGYSNYRCTGRSGTNGICAEPARISVRKADAYVEREFLAHVENVQLEGAPADDEVKAAIAQVEAAEAELAAYRDANLISVIGREMYITGLQQRADAVNAARAEAEAVRRRGGASELVSADLRATWPELSTAERRVLLGAVIDSIVVRREGRPGKNSPAERRCVINWVDDSPVEVGPAAAHDREERVA